MFRSNWHIYVAFGIIVGIVSLGVLGQRWDSHHYYETPEPQYTVDQTSPAIIDSLPALDKGEYSSNQGNGAPGYDARTVLAAEDSAFWTMMTAIIGGTGTIIVGISLIFSARATEAAMKATFAAQVSNKIALAESRPWVICDGIDLTGPVSYRLGRFEFDTIVRVKNTGPVLALNVLVNIAICRMENDHFVPFYNSHPSIVAAHFAQQIWPITPGGFVAPGQTVHHNFGWGGPLPERPGYPNLQQVIDGAFYLVGYISYDDPLGNKHHTRFVHHPQYGHPVSWDQMPMRLFSVFGEAT